MENIKVDTTVSFNNIEKLKGLYIINKNGNIEEINHIVDRNIGGETLRINGIYHKFSDLVFLKKDEDIFIDVRVKKVANKYSIELLEMGFKQ